MELLKSLSNHILPFSSFIGQPSHPSANDEIDNEIDAIRASWRVGSTVEIYSESSTQWHTAKVTKISHDEEGEWLEVRWNAINNTKRVKLAAREDKSTIRPIKLQKQDHFQMNAPSSETTQTNTSEQKQQQLELYEAQLNEREKEMLEREQLLLQRERELDQREKDLVEREELISMKLLSRTQTAHAQVVSKTPND
eukprot:268596_1